MGCSDSLTSIPPHFVAFVWRYRVCARCSLPGEGSAPAWVLGLITGRPPGIERGEIRPSQVPGGPPCMRAPLCDPDLSPASGHLGARDAAFRLVHDVGQGNLDLTGLNHAAHMLAVYASAASVTRNATQDSLPAGGQPLLGGVHPPGPIERFPVTSWPSPFPKLAWRTNHPSIWASVGHRFFRFFGGA